ncbi:cellobiose dehydrogenase [Physcia stellaris]|nr:cellobiose dehydrogenase [Physcia stellaris]
MLFPVISLLLHLLLVPQLRATPVPPKPLTERAGTLYDVIVVGTGPAGVIIASRLSENPARNVLLLEGGGPSYWITGGTERPSWLAGTSLSRVDVPGLYSTIYSNPSTQLLCQNKIRAYGACTIGGNSAINAGLFYEPPASDFDKYFPTGWKYSDVAPSISRLYATQPSTNNPSLDGIYYEQSGYTLAKQWLVNNAGYTELSINANSAKKTKVFGHPVYDYANGQRGGPVVSYLQTALKRSNFHLQSGTWVQRIVQSKGVATGVVVNTGGVTSTIGLTAKGRVIVSGGALKSPELLMKSGIGDPTTLTTLSNAGQLGGLASSNWVNNSAVGVGLFDNPNTFIELSSPALQAYNYNYDNPIPADRDLYLTKKSGPYSFAGGSCSFWDTVVHADGTVAGVQGGLGAAGYQDYTDNNTVTMNIYGTSGLKSSGKVVLGGSDYLPGPDGNVYYSNPQDAQDIATFIRRLFDALPGTGLTPRNLAQTSSVADIVKYITSWTPYTRGQVNHWSSSCRIGSCVDVNTTVIGAKNIHVVDASIVAPLTVNPQMGVMIAAERAWELINKLMV